jgi:hypothetical protein
MGATIVGYAGAGNNTASTSLVINVPTGTQPGDVMFVGAAVGSNVGTFTQASFTAIIGQGFNTSKIITLYRNVINAEPASYTFTSSNHISTALIVTVRGLNVVQTLISLQVAANAASTTITGNPVTSTMADQLNFWFGATDSHTAANNITAPTAMTKIGQQSNGNGAAFRTIAACWQVKASVGATGTTERNGTCATSDESGVINWIAQIKNVADGLLLAM